jgi:hypothetical protein
LDISISGDKQSFTVTAALAYSDTHGHIETQSENDMNTIPLAFGYRAPTPPVMPRINIAAETIPEPPVIGSIRGGGTHIIFYRDTSSGRIRTRENL